MRPQALFLHEDEARRSDAHMKRLNDTQKPVARRGRLPGAAVSREPRAAQRARREPGTPKRFLLCTFPNGAPHHWWETAPGVRQDAEGRRFQAAEGARALRAGEVEDAHDKPPRQLHVEHGAERVHRAVPLAPRRGAVDLRGRRSAGEGRRAGPRRVGGQRRLGRPAHRPEGRPGAGDPHPVAADGARRQARLLRPAQLRLQSGPSPGRARASR